MKDIGVYIHIPFCESKCYYCDFCSYKSSFDIVSKYVNYLKREIDTYKENLGNRSIKTIFIGGGTPSIIRHDYIYDILNHLYKSFSMDNLEELTIECNPKTLNDTKLKSYKDIGINRISLGLQSMDNKILTDIGRIHTKEDFLKTYDSVRKYGFSNVNVDVMFNLPNQSVNNLFKTLKEVSKLSPEHISFYSLKVEEGTIFYNMDLQGKLNLPSEDDERKMYHMGIDYLESMGYKLYEISNFAKKGYESKHNLRYWQLNPYIGLGVSAHSNINGQRYGNFNDFNNYFKILDKGNLPVAERELINRTMEMAEYTILGLRLIEGINKHKFKERFNVSFDNVFGNIIYKLKNDGLLIDNKDNVKLTLRGLDLSNIVFMELLP